MRGLFPIGMFDACKGIKNPVRRFENVHFRDSPDVSGSCNNEDYVSNQSKLTGDETRCDLTRGFRNVPTIFSSRPEYCTLTIYSLRPALFYSLRPALYSVFCFAVLIRGFIFNIRLILNWGPRSASNYLFCGPSSHRYYPII